MTDLNQGLFICNKLNPYKGDIGKKFCRIIAVSVYSSNSKTRKNIVAYKVGYWDEEPKTIEDYALVKTYRSNSHGQIIHVIETERKFLDRDELIYLCAKHFLEKALFDYTPKLLSDAVAELTAVTSRQFLKSNYLPGKLAVVWDVYHKTRYETTTGQVPELLENVLKYKGNFLDGKTLLFDWDFKDSAISFNTNWTDKLSIKAIAHLDTSETIDYCNSHFLG